MSLKKLQNCIEKSSSNISRAREAIYRLLLNSEECLSVSQMLEQLSEEYPKKISQNTLYRHLGYFIECKLVLAIQDNYKKAYYYINDETIVGFCICTVCNSVTKLNLAQYTLCEQFKNVEFITIHKECRDCK